MYFFLILFGKIQYYNVAQYAYTKKGRLVFPLARTRVFAWYSFVFSNTNATQKVRFFLFCRDKDPAGFCALTQGQLCTTMTVCSITLWPTGGVHPHCCQKKAKDLH